MLRNTLVKEIGTFPQTCSFFDFPFGKYHNQNLHFLQRSSTATSTSLVLNNEDESLINNDPDVILQQHHHQGNYYMYFSKASCNRFADMECLLVVIIGCDDKDPYSTTVSALFEPRGSIFQNGYLTSDCHIKKA